MARFPDHPRRRVAVVTGASSGIGSACAGVLAAAGHPVVLGARRLDECERLASAICAGGGEAWALAVDVADPRSVDAFASAACDAAGAVEIVVSSAGANSPTSALDTDTETFARLLEVNVLGAHSLVRAFVPAMRDRGRGDIVFVTSETVRMPRPHMASYVASKWGLEGLARTLQMELEGTGVRASIVQPGPTRTAMGLDWDPDATERALTSWVHWGLARHDHFLPPESVAEAVLAVVGSPRGTHLSMVEVQPEAPLPRAQR
ncbi:MAG: SDR family oxidoreductase [Acidimicrobiales bacterium]